MKPVIQCITNDVTKNDCANAVLAVGASPIMAHHKEEVEEVQLFSSGLLLNLGAPEDFEAMKMALATAKKEGHPVVLDPVGVSGISFRRRLAAELLAIGGITCIRGNYNEIRAIVENRNTAAGLDAETENDIAETAGGSTETKTGNTTAEVSDTEKTGVSEDKLAAIMEVYAQKTGIILVASGVTDIITDGCRTEYVKSGTGMMSRVTGMGCMASAVLTSVLAFEEERRNRPDAVCETAENRPDFVCRAAENRPDFVCEMAENRPDPICGTAEKRFDSICRAMELYGKCGERAAWKTEAEEAGTGTFRQYFMDELYLTDFVF